ncbi:MAG: ankyrin repeat domain-containing protein [Bacteroidales bacterium]|nr:ankyrin repeat domain-containing protein [Bacteroidales bacterium]
MVNSGNHRNIYWLLSGLLFLLLLNAQVFAQEKDLLSLSDTSYFKIGNNDWNLVESVLRGESASVLMLLKRGADPNAKADGGMTALMYAAESGNVTVVKLLVLNGAELELTHVENTTPLMVAVLNQHFDAAQYLLEKGADPDHHDDFKGAALIYAAAMNEYRIADLLLHYGASDTIRDGDGNDALMTAVFFGNIETVDVLLQNNLRTDAPDKKRNTPLMIASQQDNVDIISLLLDYGAGLEQVNKQNYTPLAHAIQCQQNDAARILVDSGANIHHQITTNRNLYDLAFQQNQKEILKMLKEKGAEPVARPDFSEFDVGWGNSFCKNEHMMQTRVSWVDRKFGFFAETGFDFRPYSQKVQVDVNDTLIFQYRESRTAWAHGVGRNFRILQDKKGMEYGAYAGLYGLLSFPRYRGLQENPTAKYNMVPSVGLYMKGKIAGLKFGTERYYFGTLYEKRWKMNITLFVRISYRSTNYVYKEINY